MSGQRLLEREGERAQLAAVLDGAQAGEGRVVTAEGEAGLGKSALLALAAELARERGMRVLSATGGVLEQDVAWGVVRQLLEPIVLGPEPLAGLLDGPARAAAPVFGLPGPAREAAFPVDAGPGLEHALFRSLVTLCETGPALLAVDDAHWCDEASLRWLVYLGRRVAPLPLAVLSARRLGEPTAAGGLLDELGAVDGALRLAPAPLSEAATAVLAGETFGTAGGAGFVRACREVTGGNPFLLGELLGELAAEGAAPSEERVLTLRPERVVSDVTRRLGRLSPAAVELARAVAVLDGDAELRHAVALAGLPLSAGEGAADELTLARLLRPGRPLRFAHPLLRAAVEAELPAARLAAAHRLAGALLDAEPALADRAAAHLLACEPAGDTWVAHKLQAAGERATARGAPEAAVRLLERARREPCDEPALELALGRAYRLIGRLGDAALALELALVAWPAGPERDEITRDLATALAMNARGEEAVALLERELDALPADARDRRVLLATQLGLGMLLDALVVDASARVEREAAGLSGDTAAERLLLGSLALIRGRTGTKGAAAAAEAAERALAAGGQRHDEAPGTLVRAFVALVLLAADRDTDAERWLVHLAAVAREDGAEMTLGIAELGIGRVLRFRGALAPARAAVERSLERALLGSSYGRVVAGGTLTALLVDAGELDDADRLLVELGLAAGPLPGLGAAATLLRGRMALHSARRRHAEACADADDVVDRLARRRHQAPGPLGEAAMAYLAAGEDERARRAAEEELERAQRWGTTSALGIAELQLGLATGDEARLERAATALAATPCRLELARALLALGAARRRANRRSEAREPLRQALDLAARCGAEPVAAEARTELAACGARPRRALLTGRDSLTASERRVAELVAGGLSNPEVARELVVSRSTVESHLKATYRKLDVSSREELAAALGESSPRLGDARRPATEGGLPA
jgi:DNA-binding CsgD family transcriptional regulator/tetratricopeptide (TPR) repeat protein